ncbi:DUF2254 domain-containing protein [Pelobacter seleniigenes]|uniref:DUF2254 domain-containing protein n=1 Tax=Pelobacter seleniigenes TaxID=407188 RepID=UPI0004A72426|nr:DUF2254 domain-containing protein [Pelobacter seleniigenes]
MRTKISNLYERIQSSYWFIPSIMAIQALAFSTMMVYVDLLNAQIEFVDLSWLKLTGATGEQNILSTIAGSMITVTGVIFSITVVSLSLTAQQYGPRLLQNFLRNRGNQIVLGTVTATFLYCLLVLRTVNESQGQEFVPYLSILCALCLAVLCVGMLIYFIHSITVSIQVSTVIANVSRDLGRMVERLFPDKIPCYITSRENEIVLANQIPEDFAEQCKLLSCDSSGYLQAIDYDGLLKLAVEHDLILRVLHHVGDFLVRESDLIEIWPGIKCEDKELCQRIKGHFITGPKRIQNQDLKFLIRELVEIASRALSPGINDPFTAMSCIDHLTLSLCELAQRAFPSPGRIDKNNKIRIIDVPPSFREIVDLAFDQIRQYGRSHTVVILHLLEGISRILPFTRNVEQRDALLRQASIIEHDGQSGLPVTEDREMIHAKYLCIFELVKDKFGLTGDLP